jgi:hypothetical protein
MGASVRLWQGRVMHGLQRFVCGISLHRATWERIKLCAHRPSSSSISAMRDLDDITELFLFGMLWGCCCIPQAERTLRVRPCSLRRGALLLL